MFVSKTRFLYLIIISLTLVGCREVLKKDALAPEITKREMKQLTTPVESAKTQQPLPKVKNQFEDIPAPFFQPVCVNLSEASSLKPVLIELARQANIDLQLDPKIDARVVFSAKDTPFIQVIESICQLAGLRYKVVNHSLRIEIDSAYVENYNVQFLNISRSSENRISIATDVFADSSNPSGKNAQDNGSNSAVKIAGNNDFWTELESNLKIILSHASNSTTGPTTPGTYSLHRQGGIVSVCGTSKHHQLVKNYLNVL